MLNSFKRQRKIQLHISLNCIVWKELWVFYCKSVVEIFNHLDDIAGTEHACAKTRNFEPPLSPLGSQRQISKIGSVSYFLPGPYPLDLPYQKAVLLKYFFVSDWSMTSFYAVSALSILILFKVAALLVFLKEFMENFQDIVWINIKPKGRFFHTDAILAWAEKARELVAL